MFHNLIILLKLMNFKSIINNSNIIRANVILFKIHSTNLFIYLKSNILSRIIYVKQLSKITYN